MRRIIYFIVSLFVVIQFIGCEFADPTVEEEAMLPKTMLLFLISLLTMVVGVIIAIVKWKQYKAKETFEPTKEVKVREEVLEDLGDKNKNKNGT